MSPPDLGLTNALLALRPALLRWALARSPKPELAEDAVQQTLLKALEQQQQLRHPAALKSWAYRILSRTLSDLQRAQAREQALPDSALLHLSDAQNASDTADEANPCPCVLDYVERLPTLDQTLILQSLQQSVQQTAQNLGISPNLASVRLHRARKALRRQLQQHCGTHSVQSCQDCGCA
jgi:RNA polymerase sigma-70 factor (ECF subfamily)